jgi:serine palmitoyltransferase
MSWLVFATCWHHLASSRRHTLPVLCAVSHARARACSLPSQVLDDSNGIGVLGATGRGSIEHAGLKIEDIDIVAANLDTSLATVGGFCVGSPEVVSHQRLSGAGYCFSASAPMFCCKAGEVALDIIDANAALPAAARANAATMRTKLAAGLPAEVQVIGSAADAVSPLVHLRLHSTPVANSEAYARDVAFWRDVQYELERKHDVLMCSPDAIHNEKLLAPPSLRVLVTSAHTEKDMDKGVLALQKALRSCLKRSGYVSISQPASPVRP